MIRVLSRQEIDVKKWDACINESETGQIFGYSWYLDVCCKDWFGLVENDYQAVFPLCSRTKIGIKYIYQPFFTPGFKSSISNSEIKKARCVWHTGF
jgi:hypothetical protein